LDETDQRGASESEPRFEGYDVSSKRFDMGMKDALHKSRPIP
jgi:hypothetical protein